MTGRSAATPAQFAHAGNLAASIARAGHHYHGAFRIALAVFALLVIAGVVVLVVRGRRPAGTRPSQQQRATAPRPATPPSRVRAVAGTVCWLLGLEEFVGQGIAQAAWTTPYSLSQDYISDLGVTRCGTYRILGETSYICSPLHDVMNVSFVLAGLFMVAGVLLLRGIWPRRPLATAGLVLIALAGVGRAPTAYYYATECRYEQPARQRFRPAADGGATSGSGWPTAECLRRRQPGGM